MDPIQITIVVISFVLTTLIVVLSIQVWHILKEIHRSLQKMNKMLDDANKITSSVGNSFSELSGFVSGLKSGISFFTPFLHKKDADE